MKDSFSSSRRVILKRSAMGLAAIAGSALLPSTRLFAADLPKVSEDEPTAKALKYVHNAAESERPSADQYCHNCRYYRGAASDEWAPCDLFPGKQVAGQGWCNVWAKKG
jgi:hypothetical protein